MNTNFSTFFSTAFIVVVVLILTVSAYTGRNKDRFLEKMTEFTNEVEVVFETGRTSYCGQYGTQFSHNITAWSSVRAECLENFLMKIEDQDVDKDDPFMYSQVEQNNMLFNMYRKCAQLATNPCDNQDWHRIKKCVRQVFMTVPEFEANEVNIGGIVLTDDVQQAMKVDTVLSERMLLAGIVANADIGKCTAKTLMTAAGAETHRHSDL